MDRAIVYDSALPQTTDILNTSKFAMIGHALLNAAILGESGYSPAPPYVHGLACLPTSPASLNVTVGVGSIYALDEVDATAYGDLGTDTNTVLKQGINYNPVTLTITPPSTSGFSQVYLVQVALNDVDSGSQVLNYFNSANPSQPYQGPANDGMSQFTTRTCVCAVALKAGVAATTGSQTTPSADVGFTGLYAITVANGATQIVSGNIVTLTTAPFFPKLPAVPYDVQDSAWVYCSDTSAGGAAPATTSSTTTASAVLTFSGGVPAYVAVGMKVFDLTTPGAITGGQTVQTVGATTVTLTANVNATVGSGDAIAFSNNAMVASVSPTPPTLVPGLFALVKASGTISGATTFNLNGLGAVAIHRANSAAVQAGDITAGMLVALVYDGSAWQMMNFEGFTSTTTNNNTFTISIPYGVDSGSVNALNVPFNPVISSLSAGLLVLVKVNNTNTGACTIVVNSNAAVPVVDCSGQPLVSSMIFAGDVALMVYDGTSFELVNRLNYQQNAFTLYVNGGTGSDSNNGLTPTTAFATIQKAMNVAGQYPPGPNTLTISIAHWTSNYAGATVPNYPIPPLLITGTGGTVTIDGAGGQAIWVRGNNNVTVSNLTLQSTGGTWTDEGLFTNPNDLLVSNATCTIGTGMVFVQPIGACICATNLATVYINNAFTINGSSSVQGTYCMNVEDLAVLNFSATAQNITLTGTIKQSQGFIKSDDCSVAQFLGALWTFTGYNNVQGPNYGAYDSAIIEVLGGGATYFPGTTAGIQSDGGLYI